jgi:parvulin-like peptidyl-prolyl isomerase
VLDALIDRELILQAAAAEGITITDEDLSARLAELQAVYATPAEFDAWLQSVGYTVEEFRVALTAELVTGRMVAQVTADVPDTAEHVRARYIQMDDAALAQAVLDRAQAGDDFAFLAQQNSVDRVTGEIGGDLGFFAAGSLLVPEVEAAAFALQPGEISDLIAVTNADGTTTYYIIQVTEREADRALGVDAYQARLAAAFDEWLAQLRAAATIERFVP